MPTFRYESLGAAGGASAATIDAPDRAAAMRLLRQRGVTPTLVEQVAGRGGRAAKIKQVAAAASDAGTSTGTAGFGGLGRGMSRADMAAFVRELATATQAGLPIVPALKTILKQRRNPAHRSILARIVDHVEHGRSLADAAESVGKPFAPITISLMRAGEMSGRLSEVLDQAANLLDRDLKTRRTLLAGMIYPAILFVLLTGAIIIISTVIVPKLLSSFAKAKLSEMPWPTQVVVGMTHFVASYWWLLAAALIAIVFVAHSLYRSPSTRLSIDRTLLKVPLLGKVLRELAVARFTRTLGTLVSAGLPALTALRITRGTLGNKAMEQAVEEVCEQVAGGKTIADPLERSGHFPALLTQIVGLGERSGRLPQMLIQAATVFEERTENSMKVFTAAFPPIMVIIAACFVGFIMAAVLLPLIQAQNLIG